MGSTTGRQKRRQWGGPLGSTSKQITLSATILQSQEAGITSDPRRRCFLSQNCQGCMGHCSRLDQTKLLFKKSIVYASVLTNNMELMTSSIRIPCSAFHCNFNETTLLEVRDETKRVFIYQFVFRLLNVSISALSTFVPHLLSPLSFKSTGGVVNSLSSDFFNFLFFFILSTEGRTSHEHVWNGSSRL